MAKTKSGGSAKNLKDSKPKYLGVKLYDGQAVKPGSIIIRQRGNKYYPGQNVRQGKDHTLFATATGKVKFSTKRKIGFNNNTKRVPVVNVIPS